MKCYNCKSQIEDDSWYCDQCGTQIFLCPDCHTPGKGEGKRCGMCGRKLVSAESLAGDQAQPEQHIPHQQSQHQQNQQKQPVCPSRLVCRKENIVINLRNGAVLGRLEGPYQKDLGRLEYISARHAQVWQEGDHWILSDLGSRNGSAVNGEWCYNPLPFRIGDTVRLANYYDFLVE